MGHGRRGDNRDTLKAERPTLFHSPVTRRPYVNKRSMSTGIRVYEPGTNKRQELNNAEARHQGDQVISIFFADGSESEAHSLATFGVLYRRFRADRAFLNQKVQVCRRADAFGLIGFDENPANTQVADARNVIAPFTTPIDPDVLRYNRSAWRSSCRRRHGHWLKYSPHASPQGCRNESV